MKDYLRDVLLLNKLTKLLESHDVESTLFVPDSKVTKFDDTHILMLVEKGYICYMDNTGVSQSGYTFTTKGTQAKWYLYEDIFGLLVKSVLVPILVTLITMWITTT